MSQKKQFAQTCVMMLAFCVSIYRPALCEVVMPSIFSDSMVIQQQKPIKIWGFASPDEEIAVTFDGEKKTVKADKNGEWLIAYPSRVASYDPVELVVEGTNTLRYENILIGEVWLCAGQSNMGWNLGRCNMAKQEVPAANHPNLRLFTVPWRLSGSEQQLTGGKWVECSPKTAYSFSAVGYFFGRDIQELLDVHLGLINASWGGTIIESWLPMEYMERMEFLKDELVASQKSLNVPNKILMKNYNKNKNLHSAIYNGMINPLTHMSFRGVIWYQGESNVGKADQYNKLMPALIKAWRERFGDNSIFFIQTQLANYKARDEKPSESQWAELREAQMLTSQTTDLCETAITIDLGEEKNIHPGNKLDVGKRLALIAADEVYKKNIPSQSPVPKSIQIKGKSVVITFDNTYGGLVAKGGVLKGFAVASADRKFVWADAKICGNNVVVCSDKVPQPQSIRYGWADNPDCTLYNKVGLPAAPFRLDNIKEWSSAGR